ncbi:MAG: hypothetical protein SGILL_001138 [Bacillariaceae sp.]
MEQVVLGIFQEQLSKVIVGFRKEQINANLLNGKGEIRDVSLNCSVLNEAISKLTPYIELDEIHVSRLGFHVTSWTNLRKAPIIVDVGHITAKVQEPLHVLPRHQRRKFEMITEAELIAKMLTEGFKPLRAGKGSYGLVDRIVDNMTIEMESFTLEYQTWGKFKTQRIGEWTPPFLRIRCTNLKVVMVDEEGNEGTPDQVWNHNRTQREKFMLYKKVSGECQVLLCPHSQAEAEDEPGGESGGDAAGKDDNSKDQEASSPSTDSPSTSLKLAETRVEVQMAVQRRLRDGAILAVQIDTTLPSVDVEVDVTRVHELAHFAAGMQYCIAKDRSFDDPLRSKAESDTHKRKDADAAGPTVRMMSRVDDDEDDNQQDEGTDKNTPFSNRDRTNTGDLSVESVGNTSVDADGASVTSWNSEDDKSNHSGTTFKSSFGSLSGSRQPQQGSNRPVMILPNAMVIYKSFSMTCAIHDVSFRGFYPRASGSTSQDYSGNDDDAYVEFVAKGCVTEMIWPKVDNEPGLYVQLSTSFVSLQERFGQRKRTVLLGGMQRDDHLSLHLPSVRPQEIGADEFFPLFERRGIRDDPLDLRHLFPTQAFGVKTTVDILKRRIASDIDSVGPGGEVETKYKVTHEMGVDEMDIVLNTDIFHRMTRFFLGQNGEGFDARWNTGDWTDLLTSEMLHHPTEVLDLDECLQLPQEIFLDENSMISSDLFNVTARLTNVEMRIPSAVQENLRACDIAMKWKETTLVVSSMLPRTFLSGKISNSITGDARKDDDKGVVDFPNDPSDICYELDKVEDPGLRPINSEDKDISTFRLQVTVRGFETNLVPTIPYCKALEPRKLLAISNSTIILCFEGEPPHDESNEIKITLFISVLVHDLIINLDLDLLAGAICTFLYHKETIMLIVDTTRDLFPPSSTSAATETPELQRIESNDSLGIKKSLKGRGLLVKQHISQSRETGGLAIVFCMQQNNLVVRAWRQNVPVRSPVREMMNSSDSQTQRHDGGLVEVLSLVDFTATGFEVGVEFDFHADSGRRTVVKTCLESAVFKVVDMEKEMRTRGNQRCLVDLCSFGDACLPEELGVAGNAQQFALRLEGNHTKDAQSWSLAADVTSPSRVNLHAEAIKNVAILVMETLLLPSWSKPASRLDPTCPFPPGTIGSMFHSLAGSGASSDPLASLDLSEITIEDSEDPVVERFLRTISKLVLPSDLHVLLLRCEIANILVSIPSTQDEEETKNLCLHLNQTDIITRFYPVRGSEPSEIESVLACKGTNWSTLINTQEGGFFHKMGSKQGLVSFTDKDGDTKVNTVVHPFEVFMTYSSATFDVSMNQGLKIDDIRQIESFQSRLKSAIRQSVDCLSEISHVAKAMKDRTGTETRQLGAPTQGEEKKADDIVSKAICHPTTAFASSRGFLQKASEELLLYEEEVRAALRKRDDELESLKVKLFMKERERFGAVAMMASRVAGWLKIGGQHRTGQRVAKKSLVWPYWTVLRKELVLMYPSPGVPKPCDVISLVNAKIRPLAGGKSKQDIKRGFAIVERNGMARYFVAGNAQEFSLWTKEIANSIRMCSDPSVIVQMEEEFLDDSEGLLNDNGEDDDPEHGDQRKRGLGNRLASSLQSAKQKAKELSDRRGRAPSSDSLGELDDNDNDTRERTVSFDHGPDSTETSRRAQIGMKFSGVREATKNRLGSAIQSARQKGAEISNRQGDPDRQAAEQQVEEQGPRRRLQLGNKLGSAIQNAKTGRLAGIRDKISQRQGDSVEEPSTNDNLLESDSDISRGRTQSFWTCEKCTFINNSPGPCEMCGEAPEAGNVQPISSVSQGVLSEIPETAEPIAEKDQPSLARNTSSEQSNVRRGSRFGFRKREEIVLDDSAFGGDSFVLKNVRVSNKGHRVASESYSALPPLKKLQRNWMVIVSSIPSNELRKGTDSALRDSSSDSNEAQVQPKAPSISENEIGLADCPGKDTSAEEHDCISSPSNQTVQGSEIVEQRPLFRVHIFDVRSTTTTSVKPEIEKQLTRADVLQFFSEMSQTIEAALPQLFEDEVLYEEAENSIGNASSISSMAEKVLVFGRILGGLLDCEDRAELRKYQCDSIAGFLNSLLECPLPIEALAILSETLGISASTMDVSTSDITGKDEVLENLTKDLPRERPGRIMGLLSACQAEMQRIENGIAIRDTNDKQVQLLSMNSSQEPVIEQVPTPVCYEPVLPPSLTNSVHDSVQEALLNMMGERDEANAQLIGANVLHIHSLERERKKIEKLEAEAKMREEVAKIQAQTDLNQPNIANFFGGKPDDRVAKMRKEIDLKIEAFHQVYRSHATTDEEIAQLCTQLSNEISAKTSHALEIKRLKDVGENERKMKDTEKSTLVEELRRTKDRLAAEEAKRAGAQKEADKWKAMYEDCTRDK